MAQSGASEAPRGDPHFRTTHWSQVLAASGEGPVAAAAISELCQAYWYPVYAYFRRSGRASHDSLDLTQEFFSRLLQPGSLAGADKERGRFRSYLLGAAKHFLANEQDHAGAKKRGGGLVPLSLEMDKAEERYVHEPSHDASPEQLFERRWAMELLARALHRVEREYQSRGREDVFRSLEGEITGHGSEDGYRKLGETLSMTEGAVKVAVHRLRGRYRAVLREEISRTVADDAALENEIRDLFLALSAPMKTTM